ncbi:hypothetical protein [Allosalinactinospora lopnorensis]|uniref:hypothetical protein n=1 Tax=Allosalinactinospora lopnorensis TaxID=1352348 RepID=UPI000623DEC5|nr:hypothetical protein [Allosalinactinospora lopnorensis]
MDPDATQIMTRTGEFTFESDSPPQWETDARERLAAAAGRFSDPLSDLVERDANQGDTQILVADFLSYGLNYSKYGELTTEYRTTGGSVDYGILISDQLFAFVEVKPCGQNLDTRNLRQARMQAADEGVEWVVLTNGRLWQVYHLGDGDASSTRLILEADLLNDDGRPVAVDMLFHLTKEAVEHGRLDDLREWREALAPAALADALRSDAVISALRRELRTRTGHTGHIGDLEELSRALSDDVITRGLLP